MEKNRASRALSVAWPVPLAFISVRQNSWSIGCARTRVVRAWYSAFENVSTCLSLATLERAASTTDIRTRLLQLMTVPLRCGVAPVGEPLPDSPSLDRPKFHLFPLLPLPPRISSKCGRDSRTWRWPLGPPGLPMMTQKPNALFRWVMALNRGKTPRKNPEKEKTQRIFFLNENWKTRISNKHDPKEMCEKKKRKPPFTRQMVKNHFPQKPIFKNHFHQKTTFIQKP